MTTRNIASFLIATLAATALFADNGTWTAITDGNWDNDDNWAGGTIAQSSGFTATFQPGTFTVTNNIDDLALLGLTLEGGSLTFTGSSLTLDPDGFLTVAAGAHTIGLPLTLSGSTAVSVAPGKNLALNGEISGTGGLALTGGRTALGAANTFTGPFQHVNGLVTIPGLAALGTGATPLVLGEGTFRYTGGTDTLDREITLLPGANTDRAIAIDITNSATVLTVTRRVNQPGGAFIKTGDGTLVLTHPGPQDIGKSRQGGDSIFLAYDEDAIPVPGTYSTFVVEKGTLVIGAPGQTNAIVASSGYIGNATLASPRMDIAGGLTRFTGGWLTIGRGTGTIASPQSPSLHIRDSSVYFDGSGLCIDNAGDVGANHRCRPVFTVTNSYVQTQSILMGENNFVTGIVDVSSSRLVSNMQTDHRYGATVAPSGGSTDMTATFSDASTLETYLLRVNQGGKLTLRGNSTLALDHTPSNIVTDTALQQGRVRFDGATLKQRTPQRIADWLINHPHLFVTANGLTLHTDTHAWLGNAILPDPENPGTATKTGPGTLALTQTPGIPLTVAQGAIALPVNNPHLATPFASPYAFEPGAILQASGANALGGHTFTAGLPTFRLAPNSATHAPERWTHNGAALRRRDGILQLTRDDSSVSGSAFLNSKHTLTDPWTLTFTYQARGGGATPADGFALVLHNDPRGPQARGGTAGDLGYVYSSASQNTITNSIALGFDVYNMRLRLGLDGSWQETLSHIPDIRNAPAHITVTHDGAGVLTTTIRTSGAHHTYATPALDIVGHLGQPTAHLGLTSATGGSAAQHTITSLTFASGPNTRTATRLGGTVNANTLTAILKPDARHNGFILGALNRTADATLDISADPEPPAKPALPGISIANRDIWRLNGAASWHTSGGAALTLPMPNATLPRGSLFTNDRYPVTGNWTARIGYDMGLASGLPADSFTFCIQTSEPTSLADAPTSGLSLQWYYYDTNPDGPGTIHTTRLKVGRRGATQVITNDIAPVIFTNRVPVAITLQYDDTAKTITATHIQDGVGTNTTLIPNIDMGALLENQTIAHFGFVSRTGGQWCENIVTRFSFERADGLTDPLPAAPPYLALDTITGPGTLTKTGNADLGLLADPDTPTDTLAVRLQNGGLTLRKAPLEPIDQNSGSRSDWILSPQAQWVGDNLLQFCPMAKDAFGTATTVRRYPIASDWTATFNFSFGAQTALPADAFSLFFHNDPGSLGHASGNTEAAGTQNFANFMRVCWYFYPDDNNRAHTVAVWNNGTLSAQGRVSHLPVTFTNGPVDIVVHYAANTLTTVMRQGSATVTNLFNGIDIPAQVAGSHAHIGFGGGTGGAYAEMRIRDFRFALDNPVDADPAANHLGTLAIPADTTGTVTLDPPVTAPAFRIASLTLGDTAALRLNAPDRPGTLTFTAATLNGPAALDIADPATLAIAAATGTGTLTKRGDGTLALTGPADYTGDTLLESGTLLLDAPNLPKATDLHVTTGGTLDLAFTGKQSIRALYVDGAAQPGGAYTSAKVPWITGDGVLIVTFPPTGTMLMLK